MQAHETARKAVDDAQIPLEVSAARPQAIQADETAPKFLRDIGCDFKPRDVEIRVHPSADDSRRPVRGGDPELVDAQIAVWRKQTPAKEFQAECLALCIDALAAFKKLLLMGAFKKLTFTPGLSEAYVELGGVSLSVRPDVLIGGPEIGAVKIYLSKTNPLTQDARGKPGTASYAAAVLHLWAEKEFGGAPPERCLVVDVFAGEVYKASSRNATRRKHMLAACQEIVAVWPWLQRPAGAPPPRASAGGFA